MRRLSRSTCVPLHYGADPRLAAPTPPDADNQGWDQPLIIPAGLCNLHAAAP
jgi:hypothetical protein